MCSAWRWVSGWEGPPSPDNIDFHSAWGVLVEPSMANAKAALLRALHDPSKTFTLISLADFSPTSFIVKHNASTQKASPFTLAFKWPFTPFLPPFWEQSLKGSTKRWRYTDACWSLSFGEISECREFVCDATGIERGEVWGPHSKNEVKERLAREWRPLPINLTFLLSALPISHQ